ncbi:hypothetical protein HPP92_024182 [Vanilla planifolia]|uniref:Uncharacterized protein n=1 Tax=Vanilla planifolia TaxID=51239 RepID=A0A835PN24_VANPL|nr:hypothetical protein HPP92_024182 [Vanilla planifolia]
MRVGPGSVLRGPLICRVEDIGVAGLIQGTVVHFNRARTVVVHPSGTISASGLGCKGGVSRHELSSGIVVVVDMVVKGDGIISGGIAKGGIIYGDASLPCELGSGSSSDSLPGSTAGGNFSDGFVGTFSV